MTPVNNPYTAVDAVVIHGRRFRLLLSEADIRAAVQRLAADITRDHASDNLLCVSILNGAFVFAADLVRALEFDPEVTFVRITSYQAMNSTGKIRELIGLSQPIKGRNILIIEDIVDTGHTISFLKSTLLEQGAGSVSFASLLFKKDAYQYRIPIDYVGFEIPNEFVVGYGLDYNGLGRTLAGIYVLDE